jgi:hypothetical protein
MPEIKRRREAGETLQQIVDWLNSQGFTTRQRHRPFTVGVLHSLSNATWVKSTWATRTMS